MNQAFERYTTTAVVLHWLTAAMIFIQFPLGWYMVDLPKGPIRGQYFASHKSIGLTILVLVIVRTVWRWRHPPPPLPAVIPAWQRAAAETVHRLFYVLFFLQPISGYISSSFSGHSTKYFGIPLPQWGWHDAALNQLFTDVHVLSSFCLIALIVAHLTGALSHGMQRDDQVLERMMPWRRRRD
jgi:cytochrome b561